MASAPLLRPTLLPGLARLWRDRHTLQLGLHPDRAILLEVPNPLLARLLDLLDGAHSERGVLDAAVRLGVPRTDARALLEHLRAAGLLLGAAALLPTSLADQDRRRLLAEAVAIALTDATGAASPAQVLRRRNAARVAVTGRGRLAAPIAVAVGQSGVGNITVDLPGRVEPADLVGAGLSAGDIGRDRSGAVADALTRIVPAVRVGPDRRDRADLVVQVGTDRPAALVAARYAQRRQPHLLVDVREGVAVIGPFVPALGRPCLHCLDLHRQDRDPGWPVLAAQLAARPPLQACTTPTLLAATGYATAEILRHLDGGLPETTGGAAELDGSGRIRHRAWPPHPGCACSRRGRSSGRRRPDSTVMTSLTGSDPPLRPPGQAVPRS
ncbi:TOMM precursor leader peptide-binding protein [Plantactinospora sp. KBS50]|uniref:TOMM precursor leader peptide-binding protein n=1 Tax=Plantactinospora sp. KBS50 TaxID=2024580 RepID=UPI000BAB1490|nr:TOMM precursor leader peptide-binding protein [Plantactinospora sp. KBS50]ASW56623.1 hypothetical protein CIK06_24370 [Plantactinospora sp. KBS50]